MPKIALVVAMRTELPHVLKKATGISRIGANVVRVAVSGFGPRRARRATQRICSGSLDFIPDLLVNAGFCGAVRNDLKVGHLVIANRLTYRHREIQLEKSPIEKLADLLAGFDYQLGQVQTFGWPVFTRAGVFGDTLAVDMEAFAIAQTAVTYQIPTVVIKAVSDIVPRRIGLFGLLTGLRRLKTGAKTARIRLDKAVIKLLEGRDLFDELATR